MFHANIILSSISYVFTSFSHFRIFRQKIDEGNGLSVSKCKSKLRVGQSPHESIKDESIEKKFNNIELPRAICYRLITTTGKYEHH